MHTQGTHPSMTYRCSDGLRDQSERGTIRGRQRVGLLKNNTPSDMTTVHTRKQECFFFFFIIIPLSIFLHTDWKVHHLTEASDTHTKQKDAFIYYISLQNTPCLLNWGTVIQSWERTASIMGRHIFTSLTPLHLFLAISVKFGPNPVAFWARKWEDRDISILTRAIQHTHYGRKDLKLISPSTINASFVTSQRETN